MRHKILFTREHNENADTALDPVRVYTEEDAPLLDKTSWYCINWDNNGLTQCHVHAVHEIDLPDWLSPEEWLQDVTGWKYLWVFIGRDADEATQRAFKPWSGPRKVAAWKLLQTKKFRSEFRASLAEGLRYWISASPDIRPVSPFTPRQWECIVTSYDVIEAKRTESSAYYAGRYSTV